MKRGKDIRDSIGQPEDPNAMKEIMALMLVMVEKAPGAFALRLVLNDELLNIMRSQGTLEQFLNDADALYADFRARYPPPEHSSRPH